MRKASRGPFDLASAEDLLLPLRTMSGLQQLIFKTLSRLASARLRVDTDFDLSAVQISGLPGNDQTLDPHRDLAPCKVIRSCPVASFDLLTKIDPADTMSAGLSG